MAYSDEDLIKAALIDDEDDDDKEEKSNPDAKPDKDDAKADEDKDSATDEDDDSDDTGDDGDKADDDKPADKPDPKDEDKDSDDDKSDDDKDDDDDLDHKPTRRERREERKRQFLESVRKDKPQQPRNDEQPGEAYKPLDYSKDEYTDEDLVTDRTEYAKAETARVQAEERQRSEQTNFWSELTYESKLLATDPKLQFLNESNKKEFDPDRAADINERYFALVGYKETPVTNQQGQQLLDPQTRQPLVNITVDRTDISYDKFARAEVQRMEDYAEKRAAEATASLETVRKNAGLRPGGTSRGGLGKLKPGDISKMSDEDFEKYDAEIDRQIAAQLE